MKINKSSKSKLFCYIDSNHPVNRKHEYSCITLLRETQASEENQSLAFLFENVNSSLDEYRGLAECFSQVWDTKPKSY